MSQTVTVKSLPQAQEPCNRPSASKPEGERRRRQRVGARIKAARREAGFTQAAVAKKLGVVSQSVTNYESGRAEPKIKNLIALAALFDVSVDWLLDLDAC